MTVQTIAHKNKMQGTIGIERCMIIILHGSTIGPGTGCIVWMGDRVFLGFNRQLRMRHKVLVLALKQCQQSCNSCSIRVIHLTNSVVPGTTTSGNGFGAEAHRHMMFLVQHVQNEDEVPQH